MPSARTFPSRSGCTVAPGFTVTEGRQVDPAYEEMRTQVEGHVVGTVLFLASWDSDFMTGQLLNVDSGGHFY
jgi:NAD(P)-dependent dehydrogenase (short-subunit alcohol dehydrogenase family)